MLSDASAIVEVIFEAAGDDNYFESDSDVGSRLQRLREKLKSRVDSTGETDGLDLRIMYIAILTVMTFCDCSIITKVAASDQPIKVDQTVEGQVVVRELQNSGGKLRHTVSKSSLIDVGVKKDVNFERLLATFKGYGRFVDFLQSRHL